MPLPYRTILAAAIVGAVLWVVLVAVFDARQMRAAGSGSPRVDAPEHAERRDRANVRPSASASTAHPGDLPDAPAPKIGDPPDGAQLQDLQFMADEEGISLDEAIARYGWHESFSMFVDDLRQRHPGIVAGAAIERDGGPWIAFAGAASPEVVSEIDAFSEKVFGADSPYGASQVATSVKVIEGRGFTEAELDRKLVKQHYAVRDRKDLVADVASGYDLATGVITIQVELTESALRTMDRATAMRSLRASAGLGEDTVVEVIDRVRGEDDGP